MRRCIRQWFVMWLVLGVRGQIHGAAWDQSFGNQGTTVFQVGANPLIAAIQRLPDGRFVFGGSRGGSIATEGLLAAVQADGSIDSSFGNGGSRIQSGQISTFELDSSGLLLAGNSEFGLTRLLPNGFLDTSFGNGGIAGNLQSGVFPRDIAVRPSDGQIIVAGNVKGDAGAAAYTASGQEIWVRQEVGLRVANYFNSHASRSLVIQEDGKIVVAASRNAIPMFPAQPSIQAHVWFRYNIDGTPDNSFGSLGQDSQFTTTVTSDALYRLKLLPDGKTSLVSLDGNYLTIWRLKTNAALDTAATVIFDSTGMSNKYQDVKFLADGGVRLAGVRDNTLYELVIGAPGNIVVNAQYALPQPAVPGRTFFDFSQILDDGGLLVAGRTWDPATPNARDLIVGRIDSNFAAVPEASGLMVMCLVCGVLGTRRGMR